MESIQSSSSLREGHRVVVPNNNFVIPEAKLNELEAANNPLSQEYDLFGLSLYMATVQFISEIV